MAETCGAVTGAFMVLGLRHAGPDCNTPPGRAKTKQVFVEFTEKFKARRGTVVCRDLLGCDISTAEGMDKAKSQGLIATVCPKVVHDAAQILDAMLP